MRILLNQPHGKLATFILAATTLLFPSFPHPSIQQDTQQAPTKSESRPMQKITGEFEVKIIPSETDNPQLGLMLLDKAYHGPLQGTAKGRMLTGMTNTKGSAGYVAIERIEGELAGKRGTFTIQHSGIMSQGKQSLTIQVIPDSGTDELVGLEGTMQIRIVDRQHFYDFEYSLPQSP